jgi:glucose-6-phosphate dehydrogenase assembly protein OpcA
VGFVSGPEMVSSWSSRDPDAAAVGAAIRRLRAGHERGAVQTSLGTVVALTGADPHHVAHATAVVSELTTHLPVRSLVVTTAPNELPGLDVGVNVRTLQRGAKDYCVEDLRLHVRGPSTRHLHSVLMPFVSPDVPVTLWFPELIPRPDDPVLFGVDRVIIDSQTAPRASRVQRPDFPR